MLDEKPQDESTDATDLETPPVESTDEPSGRKAPGPLTAMVFVIFALLAVLVAIQFRAQSDGEEAPADPEIAELRAELEASRAELNRQLIEAGLPPRQGGPESVDQIVARLRQDVDALASIATEFQEVLAERVSVGTTRDAELLEAEKARQSLVVEVSRLRQELEDARRVGGEAQTLRDQLDRLQAEREQLAAALSEARAELAGYAEVPDAADYQELQRRFEEAQNAKEFFEARASELEQAIQGD